MQLSILSSFTFLSKWRSQGVVMECESEFICLVMVESGGDIGELGRLISFKPPYAPNGKKPLLRLLFTFCIFDISFSCNQEKEEENSLNFFPR